MKNKGKAVVCLCCLTSVVILSSAASPSPKGEETSITVVRDFPTYDTRLSDVEPTEDDILPIEIPVVEEISTTPEETVVLSSESTLNESNGVFYYNGFKETYYNLNMASVVSTMKRLGYDYEYWVRADGVKMFGDYIIVAADLNLYPRGTLLETSLGTAIVCDTGSAIVGNVLDVAVSW